MVCGYARHGLFAKWKRSHVFERDRIALAREQSRSRAAFSGRKGPAVIVLAQWNARWEEQQSVCRWLNRLGITAIKMSLPYHDRRAIPGHPRADYLVGSNIGLTIQANRQAVLDVRRTLRWLEQQGYGPLGVLGTSIGSCIGFITMCHEPALRAGAFLHVSTYFGQVVAHGLTTANVWESLQQEITVEEAHALLVAHQSVSIYWETARRRARKCSPLLRATIQLSGPNSPMSFWARCAGTEIPVEALSLRCGHYSLGVAPFKYIVGHRFGKFLKERWPDSNVTPERVLLRALDVF